MQILDTAAGQAAMAFVRMFAATMVASWVNAGMPVRTFSGHAALDWAELAIQAGAALVIANYFGPWEKRYGMGQKNTL